MSAAPDDRIEQVNPEDTSTGQRLAGLRREREAMMERRFAQIGGVQWCHAHAGVAYDDGERCDLFAGASGPTPCRLVDIFEAR